MPTLKPNSTLPHEQDFFSKENLGSIDISEIGLKQKVSHRSVRTLPLEWCEGHPLRILPASQVIVGTAAALFAWLALMLLLS